MIEKCARVRDVCLRAVRAKSKQLEKSVGPEKEKERTEK